MQNQWYIAREGKQYGPVSDGDLVQLIQNRELFDGDFLWRQGFENWLPAAQIPELADLVNGAPQTKVVQTPQPENRLPEQDAELEFAQTQTRMEAALQDSFSADQQKYGATSNDHIDPIANNIAVREEQTENPYQQEATLHEQNDAADFKQPIEENFDEFHNPPLDDSPSSQGYVNETVNKPAIEERGVPMVFQNASEAHRAEQHDVQYNHFINEPELAGVDASHDRLGGRIGTKKSWPIWVGACAGVLVLILVAAVLLLPFIVPPDTIKSQISAMLKEQTGREVSLKGKLSYRFFPSFGIDMNKIVIHNPPGIKGPHFLNLARLQADLKIWPLLQKKIEVNKIILHRAEFALITDRRGRNNYQFKTAQLPERHKFGKSFKVAQAGTIDTSDIIAKTLEKLEREEQEKEQAGKRTKGKDDPRGPNVRDLATTHKTNTANDILVDEIQIINGAVKLIDQATNNETEIKAINLTINAPAHESPVNATGAFRYLENRISVDAKLSLLRNLLKGEATSSNVTFKSDLFEGRYEGQLLFKDSLKFTGVTDAQTYSLKKLLSWLGTDVPHKGYGASYVRGKIDGDLKLFTVRDAKIKFDQNELIGSMNVREIAVRPRITAQFKTEKLDLTPYLEPTTKIKRSHLGADTKRSIAAWNSSKIDLSFLKIINGDLRLQANQVIVKQHLIEQSEIAVKMNNGHMMLNIPRFNIYGGAGALNLIVNASKDRPSLKSAMQLRDVQIKPLFANTAGFDWVSGKGDVKLEIVSAGHTEQQLISLMNGNGRLTIRDGAIEGVNIAQAIRGLQSGKIPTGTRAQNEKTDFSSLNASFRIEKGIVYNKDLLLKSPLLRVAGEGEVNLPQEVIDYGFNPKLIGNLEGQGGEDQGAGISIPVRLVGPLQKPKIIPDAKALVKNQGKNIEETVKTVEKVVKKIKKKKISSEEMKNLLDGMIDGDSETGIVLDNILQ